MTWIAEDKLLSQIIHVYFHTCKLIFRGRFEIGFFLKWGRSTVDLYERIVSFDQVEHQITQIVTEFTCDRFWILTLDNKGVHF